MPHDSHKDDETDELDDRLAGFAAPLIAVQITGATAGARPGRARDAFARGYVLGVCDAVCQRAGIEDERRCIGLCVAVLMQVHGEEAGEALGRLLMAEMGSGASLAGQQRGGEDLIAFLLSNDEQARPPMGLLDHICAA